MGRLSDCNGGGHHGPVAREKQVICGDGFVDPGEACDDGEDSSDTRPDACRSDCRRAGCGDFVVDSGEECDEGNRNDNSIPNRCRVNCRLPVCGDGVVDDAFEEQCDDGNRIGDDGCTAKCIACTMLTQGHDILNIDVDSDTTLCRSDFNVADYGDDGVIIVKKPGITVDCDGASLRGSGIGVGIFVKQCNDVTIKNCNISGYEVGIKAVNSQNLRVIPEGNVSGNTRDIVVEGANEPPVAVAAAPSRVLRAGAAGTSRAAARPAAGAKERSHTEAVPRPQPTPKAAAPARAKAEAAPKPTSTARQAGPVPATRAQRVAAQVAPTGRIVKKGKQRLLTLSTKVKRVFVYAGGRRVARFSDGNEFDITAHVAQAEDGELTIHCYDDNGVKTILTVNVGD